MSLKNHIEFEISRSRSRVSAAFGAALALVYRGSIPCLIGAAICIIMGISSLLYICELGNELASIVDNTGKMMEKIARQERKNK